MRIVLASDWWPPRIGGIESQMADLASVLAGRGHDVHVLTTTEHAVPVAGLQVERLVFPMAGHVTLPAPGRIADIAVRLEALAPDVVHAHGMFSPFATLAIMAADRLRIPSVMTVHSLLRPWPVLMAGGCVFRLFAHRATVVTGVSAATVLDVARASGRDAVRMPNGVHLAEWRRPPQPSPGIRLVSVTRLHPKKSPVDLVDALHAAVQRLGREVTLTIAGDGPERSRLERRAATLGVSAQLHLLGRCSRPQIRDLLATASLLAHPGQHEAFGLAILEARAAGVPVVAMASGGVPDLVEHRRHGVLATTRRGFCEAVAMLAEDDHLRAWCAAQAPLNLEEFDWPRVVLTHEAVYDRAVSTRAQHR